MRPSIVEVLAAALLVLALAGLVVLIVVGAVPEGGPPTLR
jgi:hypothetical protein